MRPPAGDGGHVNLLGLDRAGLAEALEGQIDRSFRVDQIYRALHERHVRSLNEITNLSKELRAHLEQGFTANRPAVHERALSVDGTAKYLLRLDDGAIVEAVDIPEAERRTLCISSQAGCALGCRFCVTGYWGAGRSLLPAEIVGQVYAIVEDRGLDFDDLNLVFMGMGEPLVNLDNVRSSLGALTETLSWRKITVSTAGVVPGIDEMATWEHRPNLAISLHAPDDERRSRLMPINRKYPLESLLRSLRRYPTPKGRPLTFEYTLIDGFNDDLADVPRLVRLLHGLRYKVNLIPLNPDPVLDPLRAPLPERIVAFERALKDSGVRCSVRRPRGDDIGAACGQLRASERQPRGFKPLEVGAT
ncbi:MAG: 23S rRNA (adenine(2503)-C(2))-methyltransferase RlmN [Acidobacteriota bacterium]